MDQWSSRKKNRKKNFFLSWTINIANILVFSGHAASQNLCKMNHYIPPTPLCWNPVYAPKSFKLYFWFTFLNQWLSNRYEGRLKPTDSSFVWSGATLNRAGEKTLKWEKSGQKISLFSKNSIAWSRFFREWISSSKII